MIKYRVLISLAPKKNMHFLPITAKPMLEILISAVNKTAARAEVKRSIRGPFKVIINQIKEVKKN